MVASLRIQIVYIFFSQNPSLRAGRIWNSADDVECSKIKSAENQTEETRGQLSLALGTTYQRASNAASVLVRTHSTCLDLPNFFTIDSFKCYDMYFWPFQNLKVLGPLELILLLVHGDFFAFLPATFGLEHKVHFQDVVNAPRFKSFV